MDVMDVTDSSSALEVRMRRLPALIKTAFFAGALGIGGFCVMRDWPEFATMLHFWPASELPPEAKLGIIALILGALALFCFWQLYRAVEVLLLGGVWEFDKRLNIIRRDGKEVMAFADLEAVVVEVDFRGMYETAELYLLGRDGKKRLMVESTVNPPGVQPSHYERATDPAKFELFDENRFARVPVYRTEFRYFWEAGQAIARATKKPCRKESVGDMPGWWHDFGTVFPEK